MITLILTPMCVYTTWKKPLITPNMAKETSIPASFTKLCHAPKTTLDTVKEISKFLVLGKVIVWYVLSKDLRKIFRFKEISLLYNWKTCCFWLTDAKTGREQSTKSHASLWMKSTNSFQTSKWVLGFIRRTWTGTTIRVSLCLELLICMASSFWVIKDTKSSTSTCKRTLLKPGMVGFSTFSPLVRTLSTNWAESKKSRWSGKLEKKVYSLPICSSILKSSSMNGTSTTSWWCRRISVVFSRCFCFRCLFSWCRLPGSVSIWKLRRNCFMYAQRILTC